MRFVCRQRFPHLRLVLPLALLAGGILRAQYGKYEGLAVRSIQFDPARQPLEAAELYEILPLKIGSPLRQADVRASLERLFATGRYADIQVDAEEYSGGVVIRFLTKDAWFIGHVSAGGRVAAPPSDAQLESAARMDLGQPFEESKVAGAEAAERRLLEGNGLYHATVRHVLDWETGKDYQQVNIHFEVESGARARFTAPALIGDPKLDPARILTATGFRRWLIHSWKPMTQERVRQGVDGVRKLYQKDQRLEARVALDSVKYDAAANTAQPILRLDAGPRIQVRTVGAKVSQRKLQRYVPVFEEHSVDRDLLVEGATNLRDYFQSNGFFDADVEFQERDAVGGVARIDYLIHTGDRHKLVAIRIHGNRYFSEEQLRERMFLRPAYFLEFPHGRYSENLLRRDEDSIANLYRSNGFRDVGVSHRVVDNFAGSAGQIAVMLEIEEGPQQFIASLTVEGIESLDKPKVLAALTSVEGQPFSEFNVAVDRDTILAKYFEAGFPAATFEWSSRPAADPRRVDLAYTVREGRRQFVREVIYTGNRTTKPRLINRTLELNPGDPLSPTAITDTQRKLYDLGVFARVDAAIQDPDGDTGRKYVLFDLEEARRYSLALGLGAEIARIGGCSTCLDAPAGQTGFSPRISLNLSRSDLWGIAHSLSLRLRASTLEQQALLTYTWPDFASHPDLKLSITGMADNSKDVRTFSYRRAEGSLQLSKRPPRPPRSSTATPTAASRSTRTRSKSRRFSSRCSRSRCAWGCFPGAWFRTAATIPSSRTRATTTPWIWGWPNTLSVPSATSCASWDATPAITRWAASSCWRAAWSSARYTHSTPAATRWTRCPCRSASSAAEGRRTADSPRKRRGRATPRPDSRSAGRCNCSTRRNCAFR